MILRLVGAASLALTAANLPSPAPQTRAPAPPRSSAVLQAVIAAEDRRASRPSDLELLQSSLDDPSVDVQVAAIRALGRLERPAVAVTIAGALAAAAPAVRAEAADALAQAVSQENAGPGDIANAAERLIARLDAEANPSVARVVLESLGRLRYASPEDGGRVRAEDRLRSALLNPTDGDEFRLGAARGLESLTRRVEKIGPIADGTAAALRAAVERPDEPSSEAAVVRRLALGALVNARAIDRGTLDSTTRDPDVQVRQIAAAALGRLDAVDDRAPLVDRGLLDSSPMVRLEALRTYGKRLQATGCQPIVSASSDANPHVVLLALDLLGQSCADRPAAQHVLERLARNDEWQRSAHAFVSLAKQFPESARPLMDRFAASPIWQVRMYAAQAALALKDADRLRLLASDRNDNVCQSALEALQKLQAHDADEHFIAALARRDYQTVLTAATALEGSPRKAQAISALLANLERVTREHRDTSRDPRVAILKRVQELGDAGQAADLQPYLRDFDPEVANLAATILTGWAKNPVSAAPLSRSIETPLLEFKNNTAATAVVSMRGRGTFELTLLAAEAPITVSRFVSLARAGYYNGLTFHRVVPNFVIQGGSPGANEYMGDGDYLRDEVARRSHRRGTLGISTRGRDTGDAQIFVNLVDNPRLDHIYTVFAEVSRGMEVVDTVLEGDVIDRIDIVGAAMTPRHAGRSSPSPPRSPAS